MPVIIESAGSHVFDLGHIRRQRGEELLRCLLEAADLPLHLTWRLQVQKKLNCNAETPPVRVVDEPRKWAVHLKIKPGDNNTCHYCSLLMPSGFSGEKLYYQIGKVVGELDRNWKHKAHESNNNGSSSSPFEDLFPAPPAVAEVNAAPRSEERIEVEQSPMPPQTETPPPQQTMPVEGEMLSVAPPAPTEAESSVPASASSGRARGWLTDPDKMRLLLLAIHEINESGEYAQDQWAELLCKRMDWEGANRHEVGGVLTGLVRRDLAERRFRGCRPYGYMLSEKGQQVIADLTGSSPQLGSPLPSAPDSLPSTAFARGDRSDAAGLIRSVGAVAKQFLEANVRLEAIAQREAELNAELDLLKQEREQICRLLDDNQVQGVLANLARLIQTKD